MESAQPSYIDIDVFDVDEVDIKYIDIAIMMIRMRQRLSAVLIRSHQSWLLQILILICLILMIIIES